jgi:hypothetical protein
VRLIKGGAGAVGISIGCLLGMFPLLFLSNRKEVYFTDEEMHLFQQYFSHMPPANYFNMLSQASHCPSSSAPFSLPPPLPACTAHGGWCSFAFFFIV